LFASVIAGIMTVGPIAALGAGPARADAVADFYKGKTMTVIASVDAGNGYDFYARLVMRHMPHYIPGAPNAVVQNMPSAGGLTATNYLYNVASKDGLTLGLIQNTVAFEPFYSNPRAKFDPAKFNWLGTPSQETGLLIVWHTVPVNTLAEAKSRGLTLGATGAASTPAFYARVITAAFGVPIKLIAGYKSQNEAFLAMERGEHEGYSSTFLSSLKAVEPTWIPEKKVKILLQYGGEANPELKDVPFAPDLLANPDDKRVMQIASAPLALGRPMLAPPGVPADRVAALRTALAATFKDADYLADCAKQKLACDKPGTGADIARIIAATYTAPEAVRTRLRDIYATGKK
jgi:tripartite-type tricarboxylate transporter receptor subunit TctC